MAVTKFVNLRLDLYESVRKASERNGYETVSGFVTDLLTEYEFDGEAVKVLLRLPADVTTDRAVAEAWLKTRVEQILVGLFP